MEDKKLIIQAKKYKQESTTIVSARIPTDLVKKIDALAKKANRNRNEMIQLLLAFAIENTIIDGEE